MTPLFLKGSRLTQTAMRRFQTGQLDYELMICPRLSCASGLNLNTCRRTATMGLPRPSPLGVRSDDTVIDVSRFDLGEEFCRCGALLWRAETGGPTPAEGNVIFRPGGGRVYHDHAGSRGAPELLGGRETLGADS
jgi:hypothetical protein